jgi:hypothetical protein
MDLKQGIRFMHEYPKLFNHLAQYALEQVDTDGKKDYFMNGLSTRLQEHLALSTGGTFLEFVNNAIIADDTICAHKESKKRKGVAASSSSAPPMYPMVYHPPRPHLLVVSASAAAVGFLPTSASALVGSTKGSTSTTACVASTYTTCYGSHLPHLLQLWPYRSLRSRVPCSKEEPSSGPRQPSTPWPPRQPSTPWPAEGHDHQKWSHQLNYYGGYSRG